MSNQVLILSKQQIAQKINRIAYQILEDNLDEKELVLAGIWERGYRFAMRIAEVLTQISDFKITLLKITINNQFEASADLAENTWKNVVVILIDDVLNSGKTMYSGLSVFLNSTPKKIRTTVLVDRSHKVFPIAIDFVGLQLATVLKEHVDVILDQESMEDQVYLS